MKTREENKQKPVLMNRASNITPDCALASTLQYQMDEKPAESML